MCGKGSTRSQTTKGVQDPLCVWECIYWPNGAFSYGKNQWAPEVLYVRLPQPDKSGLVDHCISLNHKLQWELWHLWNTLILPGIFGNYKLVCIPTDYGLYTWWRNSFLSSYCVNNVCSPNLHNDSFPTFQTEGVHMLLCPYTAYRNVLNCP